MFFAGGLRTTLTNGCNNTREVKGAGSVGIFEEIVEYRNWAIKFREMGRSADSPTTRALCLRLAMRYERITTAIEEMNPSCL
jgi:hypothetical protein